MAFRAAAAAAFILWPVDRYNRDDGEVSVALDAQQASEVGRFISWSVPAVARLFDFVRKHR